MIELRLLGSARVELEGELLRLERHALALICYLALNGSTGREVLARLLWTQAEPAQARGNLRQLLWRLRRAGLGEALRLTPSSVALHLPVHSDLDRFHAELEAQRFESALGLMRGAPLEGFALSGADGFAAWLEAERERFAHAQRRVLVGAATQLERRGAKREALELYLRLLAEDELQEPHQREAMRLEAALGDRGAALRRFDYLVCLLREELGLEPLAETVALAQQIRSGQPSPRAAPVPDAPSEAVPFVGRSAEWARLEAAGHGVALITGASGSGKSRLARAFAQTFAPSLRLEGNPLSRETPLYPLVVGWREALRDPRQRARFAQLGAAGRRELGRWMAELEAPSDSGGAPPQHGLAQLSEAIVASVGAQGIVVLEDLPWFDLASLELASHLVGRVRLVATAREDERAAQPEVWDWVRQLEAEQRLTRLHLAGLNADEVLALTRAVAPRLEARSLAPALREATGGQPLLALETLRYLARHAPRPNPIEPVPLSPAVIAHALERVAALEPGARRWLERATLAAPSFAAAALDTSDAAPGWLEVAVRAGFLEPVAHSSGLYRFSAPLLRAALRAGLSPERRRLLQRPEL